MSLFLAFYLGSGDQTQIPMLVGQAELFPQLCLLLLVFKFGLFICKGHKEYRE